MNTFDYFDERSQGWTEHYANDPRFRRRFEKIAALIERNAPQPGNALDAGCGSGVFTRYLAAKGWNVTALDGSPAMIEQAKANITSAGLTERVQFVNSAVEDLETEAQFDLVLSLSMLEYVEQPAYVLQQLIGLVTEGGVMIVSVPNRRGLLRLVEQSAMMLRKLSGNRLFAGRGEYLSVQRHQFLPGAIDNLMAILGFEKIDSTYLNAGFTEPEALLPFFERGWWAAMYCGVYRKKI